MHGIAEKIKTAFKIAWLNLAILTTLLVCVECLAFGYYSVRRAWSGYDPVGAYIQAQVAKMPRDGYPGLGDQNWFAAYWQEFNQSTYAAIQSVSYSNWHRRPFKGRYINVDQNGRRATWNRDQEGAPGSIRIALFGGSTMWGTGARDEFTIPSYISKMLAEKYPQRFNIVNYGQDGYVSTQEVITLLREIQKDNIPDIVVFYDGYNEVYTGIQSGAAGSPMNEDNRMREFNILHPTRTRDFYLEALSRTNTFQLLQGLRAGLSPDAVADPLKDRDNDTLARDVVKVYFRNVEAVNAVKKEFGMVVHFFWQPSVYTRTHPTETEQSIIRASGHVASFYQRAHEEMKQVQRNAGPANFRDISNVLDGYAGTAYIDTVHATELANEKVAREIVSDLGETLEQVTSRTRVVHFP